MLEWAEMRDQLRISSRALRVLTPRRLVMLNVNLDQTVSESLTAQIEGRTYPRSVGFDDVSKLQHRNGVVLVQ